MGKDVNKFSHERTRVSENVHLRHDFDTIINHLRRLSFPEVQELRPEEFVGHSTNSWNGRVRVTELFKCTLEWSFKFFIIENDFNCRRVYP